MTLLRKQAELFRVLTGNLIRRLGTEFIWVALGQALVVVGSIVGVRLLTVALAPNIYGELSLALTAATLANQTIMGPLAGAVMRFFSPAKESGHLHEYLRAVFLLTAYSCLMLIAIGVVIGLGIWASAYRKWLELSILAVVFALLSGFNATIGSIQSAARQRDVVALHEGVGTFLRFLVAVGCIGLIGASSAVALTGYVLAGVIILISQAFFLRIKILSFHLKEHAIQPSEVARWSKQMQVYGWPFAVWGVFTWMQAVSDRWALQIFTNTSDVGYYAVLYQLGYYPVSLLSGLIMQFVIPLLFQKAGDGLDEDRMRYIYVAVRKLVAGTLVLTGVGTLTAWFIHDHIFALLTGPEYRPISWLLPWMVLAGGLFASGQMATLAQLSEKSTKVLISPKIGTAVTGVVFSLLGVYIFGLSGAVAAMVITMAIYLIWIIYASHLSLNTMALMRPSN